MSFSTLFEGDRDEASMFCLSISRGDQLIHTFFVEKRSTFRLGADLFSTLFSSNNRFTLTYQKCYINCYVAIWFLLKMFYQLPCYYVVRVENVLSITLLTVDMLFGHLLTFFIFLLYMHFVYCFYRL